MKMSLDLLREAVSERLSPKRMKHTLGVEAAAVRLGEALLPDRLSELRAAALLHDIAKELQTSSQLELIDANGVLISDEDRATVSALHAFAGVAVVRRDFAEYASADILSAIGRHTLGAPDMSIFDKIIYISDYIEDGRTYEACKMVRDYLYEAISEKSDKAKMLRALDNAIVMSIDFTIESLINRGLNVNSTTINTKNSLLPLI